MLQSFFSPSSSNPIIGRRVCLNHTSDRFTKLKPGDKGVVFHVDDLETVFIKWDDGSTLGLIPEEDRWGFVD